MLCDVYHNESPLFWHQYMVPEHRMHKEEEEIRVQGHLQFRRFTV